MKKIFFFTLFSLCSLLFVPCSNAQGNLQFNQVITLNGSFTSTPTGKLDLGTVPVGKVWKMEYFTIASTYGAGLFVNNAIFVENNVIWFKSGDLISARGNCGSCGPGVGTYIYFVSIIEFNVVQ
jgi:hypothetical protein